MLYLNKQKTCPSFTLFIEYEKKTNKTYLYEVVYECPQEDNDLSQPAKSSLPKNSLCIRVCCNYKFIVEKLQSLVMQIIYEI